MHVVATAGHVDHGKSTLVRALTGMEPDRWAEERRRGHDHRPRLRLDRRCRPASGVAFVDVPGHERFVPNMLAGVGPVPAVLFVVAADEGWMPQSAEHLAALDALGVRHGLLAVTRSDLADPGPAAARAPGRARGDLAWAAVRGGRGQRRAPAPGWTSCGPRWTGWSPRLPAPDAAAPVRLWVDRVVHHPGQRHRRHRHARRRHAARSATSWSWPAPAGRSGCAACSPWASRSDAVDRRRPGGGQPARRRPAPRWPRRRAAHPGRVDGDRRWLDVRLARRAGGRTCRPS